MKILGEKLRKNNKGFTLAELLIVVAIIGVLVAVSIPIFTTQLEKSRENTDIANLRAAKAAAIAMQLNDIDWTATGAQDGYVITTATAGHAVATAYFDAAAGVLKGTAPTQGYGKGTAKDGGAVNTVFGTDGSNPYSNTTSYTNQYIVVTIAEENGAITLGWASPAAGTNP